LFASCLLMPLADYSAQVAGQQIDLDLFKRCAARYGVSLTAGILKWLDFTSMAAVLVCSRDGFINWAVSSKPAMFVGAYFRTRGCPPPPVPEAPLAAVPPTNLGPASRAPGGGQRRTLRPRGSEEACGDHYGASEDLAGADRGRLDWRSVLDPVAGQRCVTAGVPAGLRTPLIPRRFHGGAMEQEARHANAANPLDWRR
jgi:hypothetical protein